MENAISLDILIQPLLFMPAQITKFK